MRPRHVEIVARPARIAAGVFLLALAAPAMALEAPYPTSVPAAEVTQAMLAACPAPPQPVGSLPSKSRYRADDPTRSKVDPSLAKAYDEAVKPLRDFQGQVVSWANEFFARPQKKADKAACALAWMGAWAKAEALRNLPEEQGQFNRDQALAGLALAYLQLSAVKVDGHADLKPDIVSWLKGLAENAIEHYETKAGRVSRANNHRYFAALGVGATGIVADDRKMFSWAMATYDQAVCSAPADGSLPLEMGRGALARDYQIFAAGPLVMLAEIGSRNGYDTYGKCDGAIHRIVGFALRSIDDPTAVEKIAGAKQKAIEGGVKGYRVAWLAPYLKRAPDSEWRTRVEKISKLKSTSLGGDLGMLYGL